MTIRELPDDEYYRIENHPYLVEKGMGKPDPAFVRFIVTEDEEGDIVGFWVIAQVPHLEPVYMDPEYQGQGMAYAMWGHVKALLARYHLKQALCCGDPATTEKYLPGLGMEKLPFTSIYLYKDK